VRLGGGNQKLTRGHCKELKVQIGDCVLSTEFFLFDLGGVDVILGIAWLATLGEVKINWRSLSMAFMHQGQNIRIQGDPSLVKSTISAKTLMRLVENKVEAMSILWIVEKEQRHVEILTEQDEELYSLLEEFTQVFAEPT